MSRSETFSSYPPHFRLPHHQRNRSFDSNDSVHPVTDSDPLPVIDLQQFNSENLGKACSDWGLFRLINHEIPITLSNQLEEEAKKLFSLPFEIKEAQLSKSLNYFWGTPYLTPSGSAVTQRVQNVNWVEGFHVPLSQLPQQLQREDYDAVDSFRRLLEEYGKQMGRVARIVFKAWIDNLGLDPTLSSSYLSESTGFIRVYRYPQCHDANRVEGMEAHTDSSVLSILNQNEVGGLQFLKDEKWFDVKPVTNTLIVNLGDMMQAMSNDEYKSVKHRVKVTEGKERISICYFVFPTDDGVIQSSKYKPFTCKEFRTQVQQDIKNIGFKVGLDRFKLGENCYKG